MKSRKRITQFKCAASGEVFYTNQDGELLVCQSFEEFQKLCDEIKREREIELALSARTFTVVINNVRYTNPLKNEKRIFELISKLKDNDEKVRLVQEYIKEYKLCLNTSHSL